MRAEDLDVPATACSQISDSKGICKSIPSSRTSSVRCTSVYNNQVPSCGVPLPVLAVSARGTVRRVRTTQLTSAAPPVLQHLSSPLLPPNHARRHQIAVAIPHCRSSIRRHHSKAPRRASLTAFAHVQFTTGNHLPRPSSTIREGDHSIRLSKLGQPLRKYTLFPHRHLLCMLEISGGAHSAYSASRP